MHLSQSSAEAMKTMPMNLGMVFVALPNATRAYLSSRRGSKLLVA
jgi:hypothetical protein